MNETRFRAAERRLWDSFGVTPTERRLPLARVGVTVRVQEVGDGPVVLFVHGASNSGVSWASLIAGLDGFRCIALDRPGCGLSERLPARLDSVERLAAYGADLVTDVLDALELERAHVVATSFGGYLALRAAAAHPDRIERIVEFGWMVGAPMNRLPFIMRLAAIPMVGRLVGKVPPNERMVRSIFKQLGMGPALADGRISQEFVDCFLAMLRDTETMANELDAGPRIMTPRGFDESVLIPADVLASIQTPILFMWGENDPLGGPSVARPFVAQIPCGELELLPGAGHAAWVDDAGRAAKAVHRFLAA